MPSSFLLRRPTPATYLCLLLNFSDSLLSGGGNQNLLLPPLQKWGQAMFVCGHYFVQYRFIQVCGYFSVKLGELRGEPPLQIAGHM